jgi:hypothetical protein
MPKEFTKENYMEFEREWFSDPGVYKVYRFGQAVCNEFDLPKEIEDKIFYEEDFQKVQVIIWTSFNDTVSGELTAQEIALQDFVDGAIQDMLCTVLFHVDPEKLPEHNIEAISEVRDVIIKYYIDGKYDEMDFYPYLEE